MASEGFESYDLMNGSSGSQSQTQTEATRATSSAAKPSGLSVVREEEESQDVGPLTDGRRAKRKAADALTSDDPDAESGPTTAKRSTKKRALEPLNNVEPGVPVGRATEAPASKPQSKSSGTKVCSGAATGQPDKDEAFLKALASTKRGKKTEDSFDREFNDLKISKPDLNGQEQQEAMWALLEDFETERNVRGNFMVIMEMDVHRKDSESRPARADTSRLDWQSRANFKKFKKVRWNWTVTQGISL
jgi:hypothetical protein